MASAGDGVFRYRDGIAVAQVVLFSVALAFAVFFKVGHRNGWFCIGVFSIFRVVGAGCMLGTITNDSKSVWAGVFVCESFGMILLIFLLLEFLLRANKALRTVHPRWFFYPQVLTWADIGLSIGGFIAASHREHGLDPTKYTQASFGLFTGLYLIVVYIFWNFVRSIASFPRDERFGIWCVSLCLPLLAVRTAYSLIYQITGDRTWNAVKGNSTAYLFMTFLPELVIIYAAIGTIMFISPPPRTSKNDKKGKNNSKNTQQRGYSLVDSDHSSRENVGRGDQAPSQIARPAQPLPSAAQQV